MFSVLGQINKKIEHMTQVEKRIAQFILGNPDKVINMPVKEIANESDTSDAAIVRFSKRIGLKGIKELKVELAKELHTLKTEEVSKEIDLEANNHNLIFEKAFKNSLEALHYTKRIVSQENLLNAAKKIVDSGKLLIYGVGDSIHVGRDFEHKLIRANIGAYFTSDRQLCLSRMKHMTEDEVLMVITLSGKSKEVIEVVKEARKLDIKIIILTHHNASIARRSADISIEVAEHEINSQCMNVPSRISQIVVCDVLFMYVCKLKNSSEDFIINEAQEIY